MNQLAHHQIARMTEQFEAVAPPTESEISRVMRELGRRGGKVGGRKRAESLSEDRRKEIAVAAAKKRWSNRGHK